MFNRQDILNNLKDDPFEINYKVGSNYVTLTIQKRFKKVKANFEIVDSSGKLLKNESLEFNSFDDFWSSIERI